MSTVITTGGLAAIPSRVDRKRGFQKARMALLDLLDINGGFRPADLEEWNEINRMVEYIEGKMM